ncbi:MAG: Gfo/Idh/MocA family oxidoreductase [Candidatus Hydrogenedens sp.]|nr:Gfo/Idh/MocA family oxidoreductase [Candidatus Hydrogenedentota bacterium]NLF56113.1 Gfo/Idh/MocA family oxidoreductase [Candidatus Hydrogenedens sp.]
MNRRQFLMRGAALGAAAWLPAMDAAARVPRRVGLLGCGQRGIRLLEALNELRGAGFPLSVAMVCDTDPDRARRAAARCGADTAADPQVMADPKRLDALVIALPDAGHVPAARAALAAGLPVYLETPVSVTVAEAETLAADAAATSAPALQIGATEIARPEWRFAAEMARAGVLGNVAWCQSVAAHAPHGAGPGWRGQHGQSLGPAAQLHFEQLVPLLAALECGPPLRAASAGGRWNPLSETPDSLMSSLWFKNGLEISLVSSPAATTERHPVLRGDRASLEVLPGGVRLYPDDGPAMWIAAPTSAVSPEALLLADWLDCAASGRSPLCPASLGLAAQQGTDMAVAALRPTA